MNNNYCMLKEGTVALLDVLGWKGIWQREENPFDLIKDLVDSAFVYSKKLNHLFSESMYFNLKPFTQNIEILSISDTIAIVCYGDISISLKPIVNIAGLLIAKSVIKKIPLRGAIAYGKLASNNNIILGPAIDEVASWYENHDNIGCIFSPSVSLKLKQEDSINKFLISGEVVELFSKRSNLKCKNTVLDTSYIINWPLLYGSSVLKHDLNYYSFSDLKNKFFSSLEALGPFYPNIDNKVFSAVSLFNNFENEIETMLNKPSYFDNLNKGDELIG